MPDINNPHDKFLKSMLSDITAAREFMAHFLPVDVVEILDLTTLKPVKESFLTGKMKELFSDLIFECQLKDTQGKVIYISILIEHKSTPEKYITIQVGQYLFEAYQQQIANKIEPLQLIVPLLYYHGDVSWQPKSLNDLFENHKESLKVFLPDFQLIFQDINRMPDEKIRQLNHLLLAPGLLMQKYYKDLDALIRMGNEILKALIETEENLNLKQNYIVYLSVLFTKNRPKLMKLINQLPADVRNNTKHYIQELIDDGKEEGREETKREAVQNMLAEGFQDEIICRIVNVSPDFIKRIKSENS